MLTHQLNEVAQVPLHGLRRQPPHQVQGTVQLVIRVRLEAPGGQWQGEGKGWSDTKEEKWRTLTSLPLTLIRNVPSASRNTSTV